MNWIDGMESPTAIEPPDPVVNTLTLTPTAGNAYVLRGVGSLLIRFGANPTVSISIAADEKYTDIIAYERDGERYFGLLWIPRAPDEKKETPQ